MRTWITVVRWKGKTVYRPCPCGETAHDAEWIGADTNETKWYRYKCRNCGTVRSFVSTGAA